MTTPATALTLVNTERTSAYFLDERVHPPYAASQGWATATPTTAAGREDTLHEGKHLTAAQHVDDQQVWWSSLDTGSAGYALVSETRTSAGGPAETKTPRTEAHIDPLNPVAIADRLQKWLGLTIDDLAAIGGISKTTIHYWHRENGKPRPATVRRLLRAYALVQALIVQRGQERTAAWLRSGNPSPLELLKGGTFEAVEDQAAAVLFGVASRKPDYAAYMVDVADDVPPIVAAAAPLRRARQSPRRGRLRE